MGATQLGRHLEGAPRRRAEVGIEHARARRIGIGDGGEPVQADSDILAHLPLEAGVDGTTIALLYPL